LSIAGKQSLTRKSVSKNEPMLIRAKATSQFEDKENAMMNIGDNSKTFQTFQTRLPTGRSKDQEMKIDNFLDKKYDLVQSNANINL